MPSLTVSVVPCSANKEGLLCSEGKQKKNGSRRGKEEEEKEEEEAQRKGGRTSDRYIKNQKSKKKVELL